LLASVEGMQFHAREAYSNLGLTNVYYSVRRLCRQEKEKVTVLINPNNITTCEKM
jgi:hypothetical protein